MKTKLVAVIVLIFCAFMAEASKVEGNGNIITKEISVDNYSEIELGGNIEYSGNNFWGNRSNKKFPVFKYTHGRSTSLKITIDENLFPLLSIKSNNGRLAIRIQDGTPYQTDPVCNRRKLEDSEILKDFRPDGF